MDREDIERMAREATDHLPDADSIRLQGIVLLALDAGAAAEREACAKVCETYEVASIKNDAHNTAKIFNHCAAAIRARSNP
jgi:hypothetical protein